MNSVFPNQPEVEITIYREQDICVYSEYELSIAFANGSSATWTMVSNIFHRVTK